MEKHYRFAGTEITLRIPEEWMYPEDRQLAPFRVSQVQNPDVFCFEPVSALPEPRGEPVVQIPGALVYQEGERYVRYIGSVENGWEHAYIRAEYGQKEHTVQVLVHRQLRHIGVRTVLNATMPEHLVVQNGGVIFHCSYIAHEGKAILFTAPSETGKSTQADLWAKHRGVGIINGDRAVLRLHQGVLTAEGIPFSGSSPYCGNASFPLGAIVYLSQAPTTSIRKLRGMEAFSKIWEGVSVNAWIREDVEQVVNVVQQAAMNVPVFHLSCTPDESAVIALEEMLRKQAPV